MQELQTLKNNLVVYLGSKNGSLEILEDGSVQPNQSSRPRIPAAAKPVLEPPSAPNPAAAAAPWPS